MPTTSQTSAPIFQFTTDPVYWFCPLPPMPETESRHFIGSVDYMDLFKPDAPWKYASNKLQVFKLYGEWIAHDASDEELRIVVDALRRSGLGLAVEAGPLTVPANCGQGVEGFAGITEGQTIARRIQQAGGQIDLIAMDEPYYYGHFYNGTDACRWTDRQIAQEIRQYIQTMRGIFPNVLVGDTEPLTGPAGTPEYQAWIVVFHAVTNTDLAFLHMDIDWSRPNWPSEVKSLADFGKQRGIPVGVIYTGNMLDDSDQSWLSTAGERIQRYEREAGGEPEQVIFQSWHDKHDYTLPESNPYTFSGLLFTFFTDKTSLGIRQDQPGSNLAFGRQVRYSSALPGYPGSQAVDADPGTWWSAGDFSPQWIEIDLGASFNLSSIRLIISQSPSGKTVHRISGRGPAPTNAYIVLHTFQENTQDSQSLVFSPDQPLTGIQYIRIDTLESPSWVAWREIEITNAGSP